MIRFFHPKLWFLRKSNSKAANFLNEEIVTLNESFEHPSLLHDLAVYIDGIDQIKQWKENQISKLWENTI